jgi:hypothetical protein
LEDLREPEQARQVEEDLQKYPQHVLEELLAEGHPLPA